jgi:hypothetical protein
MTTAERAAWPGATAHRIAGPPSRWPAAVDRPESNAGPPQPIVRASNAARRGRSSGIERRPAAVDRPESNAAENHFDLRRSDEIGIRNRTIARKRKWFPPPFDSGLSGRAETRRRADDSQTLSRGAFGRLSVQSDSRVASFEPRSGANALPGNV